MLLQTYLTKELAKSLNPSTVCIDLLLPLAERLRPLVAAAGLVVVGGNGPDVLRHVFGITPKDTDALFRAFLASQREGTTRQDEVDACGMVEWIYCACIQQRPPDVGYLFALRMRRQRTDPVFRFVLFVVALLLATEEPVALTTTASSNPIKLRGERLLLLDAKAQNTVLDVAPDPWSDYIPEREPALRAMEPHHLFFMNIGRVLQAELLHNIDVTWTELAGALADLVEGVSLTWPNEDGKAEKPAGEALAALAETLRRQPLDSETDAAVREFLFRVGCTGSLRSALDGPFAPRLGSPGKQAALAFCEAVAALAMPYGPFGSLPRWAVDEFTGLRLKGLAAFAEAVDARPPPPRDAAVPVFALL